MSHLHLHSEAEKKALQNRLRRIAGQVRGIEKMIQEDKDCSEVLNQVISTRQALKALAEIMIQKHTESCIAKAANLKEGQKRLKELLVVLKRYVG